MSLRTAPVTLSALKPLLITHSRWYGESEPPIQPTEADEQVILDAAEVSLNGGNEREALKAYMHLVKTSTHRSIKVQAGLSLRGLDRMQYIHVRHRFVDNHCRAWEN
jgi:hypothetical protein